MSTLADVQARIAEIWESTTPPVDAAKPYRETRREFSQGAAASAHRHFWFESVSGTAFAEVTDYTVFDHAIVGVVHLGLSGKDLRAQFADPASEAIALMRAINTASLASWPTGTRAVSATRYERIDLEEVQGTTIVISIEAQTEET